MSHPPLGHPGGSRRAPHTDPAFRLPAPPTTAALATCDCGRPGIVTRFGALCQRCREALYAACSQGEP